MMGAVARQVQKGLGQIRQTFLGLVARGGSKQLQLTGVADEVLQEVELIQQVGFSSYIPENSKVVIVPLQGKTARSIVVATTGGAVVVNVAEGEVCIYDQFGHSVWLKEDGTHIEGNLFVNGKVQATEDVLDQKGSMQEMRDAYNPHTHGNSPPPLVKME